MTICFILQLHVLSEYGANTERIRSGHITQKYRLSKSLILDVKIKYVCVLGCTKRSFICFIHEKMMYICIFRQKDIEQ